LNPGEEVEFAEARDSGDFKAFIRTCLQAFASGAGLAEYQISGDLSGINYSSIRAGLLEFRRKCEQFQYSVFTFQVCHPIYRRWLREAMLATGVRRRTADRLRQRSRTLRGGAVGHAGLAVGRSRQRT
jgi:capsid protein